MAFIHLFTVHWCSAKTCKINQMVHYVLCLLRSEAEINIASYVHKFAFVLKVIRSSLHTAFGFFPFVDEFCRMGSWI